MNFTNGLLANLNFYFFKKGGKNILFFPFRAAAKSVFYIQNFLDFPFFAARANCGIDKTSAFCYNISKTILKIGSDKMSDKLTPEKKLNFSINNKLHHDDIVKLGKAISIPERLAVLELLQSEPKYLVEIAEHLDVPLSSVSRHVDALTEAGLIFVSYKPGPKGHSKLCAKAALSANITFEDVVHPTENAGYVTEMPVGLFSDCDITAPCGMVGKTDKIGDFDNPAEFFAAERVAAELLWFNTGFVSYKLPAAQYKCYKEISVSFEVCSETIYHRNKWPSDITVSINDVEIDTFTSAGDFGGRRGKYTPAYWPVISTQYGVLMKFTVNANGVYVNNVLKNAAVTIDDLNLLRAGYVKFSLEIKEDAAHKGGINLFGKSFGDFPQAIVMTMI